MGLSVGGGQAGSSMSQRCASFVHCVGSTIQSEAGEGSSIPNHNGLLLIAAREGPKFITPCVAGLLIGRNV